ncbi:MAG: cytochrome c oxidase subunit 3 [Acidimicrobiales bacterium]
MSETMAPPRPRMLISATGLVVAGGIMFFAGMIAIFANLRHDAGGTTAAWLPDGATISNAPLTFSTLVTLVLSLITVQWAVSANRAGDRNNAVAALGLTVMLGLAHINMIIFSVKEIGIGMAESEWATLAYTMTAASLVTTVFGIGYLLAATVKLFAGQVGRRNPTVSAGAFFWYFQVFAWFAVFTTVYLIK